MGDCFTVVDCVLAVGKYRSDVLKDCRVERLTVLCRRLVPTLVMWHAWTRLNNGDRLANRQVEPGSSNRA